MRKGKQIAVIFSKNINKQLTFFQVYRTAASQPVRPGFDALKHTRAQDPLTNQGASGLLTSRGDEWQTFRYILNMTQVNFVCNHFLHKFFANFQIQSSATNVKTKIYLALHSNPGWNSPRLY